MKIATVILSTIMFFIAGNFLFIDLQPSSEINSFIYISLLVILMLICVVGVLLSYPLLILSRKNSKTIIYNSYSSKRILNKDFDNQCGITRQSK